ncbi:DUF4189 domain-containing protein [Falsiroseomonas selenitidurans]|uniref:DUF4189 domain-containing protein n=1 Tax=Falsiroseomonas selenitidurans TaxID=2716335 RepID=A0ABX1DWY9_9PROT|nr:DUF4189 domain-containing protein [Falsiroseomonas selenitidurans]NKC29418.1 DUF4189 domain-containing protein [Falsiroseomonas selenitidurans]
MRDLDLSAALGLTSLWRVPLLLLAFLLPAVPLAAQTSQAAPSLACRRQCEAQTPDRATNPRALQVCLLRCSAGEAHLARQRRAGTPEATGQGSAPRGQGAAAGRRGRAVVAYAGALPHPGLAVSRYVERQAAHRAAETECFRRNGNRPCRLLVETEERCVAVARAIRPLGLVLTQDPASYSVVYYAVGTGSSATAAQQAAMRDCNGRIAPGLHCRMATSRCG